VSSDKDLVVYNLGKSKEQLDINSNKEAKKSPDIELKTKSILEIVNNE